MQCTIEIFIDGQWQQAGIFEPDAGTLSLGINGGGRFDYDIDYAVEYLDQGIQYQVGCCYPVGFELFREPKWPAFLLDLLPTGAGRRVWVKRLGLTDSEKADWELLLHGAGNPPGNLRIAEAISRPVVDHFGFAKTEIIERREDFIEYAEKHGAMVAGATDVQGDAPKFLLTQDVQGRWHADGALADEKAARFWLVKFPRGKTEADRTVLRNEAPYYEVARWFGIRTGGPLEFSENTLFIPRFDRQAEADAVKRFGLETLASAAGIAEFGKQGNHLVFCEAIARHATDPEKEILEYLRRDVLNVALRNTDNHGRNTALIKTPDGRVELAPLYDFAPMFLDPEGIPRASRWPGSLEPETGRPAWRLVAEALSAHVDPGNVRSALRDLTGLVVQLPEVMRDCGVEKPLIERLFPRIRDIAGDLEAALQ
ncbi:phosphatidylinositol kinase [Geothermobacter hydrogeniphilus]|uniref:Phosphatidylinositol kinase n=1 Tax=Geothermobacter hydrogeniphilus TaxID=1969733 RepID=A0A2K2H7A4_9BACT|nr:HipA domain-containing protein [Geothermobacter hydrogeniphilus]PNU19137.1 phosphatidylinositol kinase [Geothermobacter hydrogeniphilus]